MSEPWQWISDSSGDIVVRGAREVLIDLPDTESCLLLTQRLLAEVGVLRGQERMAEARRTCPQSASA